jgi:aspartyl-tRNA(Asn)/glutamyl-tRNA(Gln) amidotransferase subunit A
VTGKPKGSTPGPAKRGPAKSAKAAPAKAAPAKAAPSKAGSTKAGTGKATPTKAPTRVSASSSQAGDLTRSTAAELRRLIAAGEVSAVEVTQAHLDRIAAVDGRVHAFLHVDADGALAAARAVDGARARGENLHALAGVPIAVKDVMATKGIPTTCGSRILEGWRPPYDATIVSRLRDAGLVMLGKTNMDEFAMGSSTEYSAYGPTYNPWDLTRIPGGSGGGSSASLAAYEAPLAIGTDTGGSIRQPGAVTGTIGAKPTYGGTSRYGLVAFSSSLDTPGPCARTVEDTALLHAVIAGHDPKDSTSIPAPVPDVVAAARLGASGDLSGVRLGLVTQFGGEGAEPGVMAAFREGLEALVKLGAEVVEVSCPHFEYALPAYYLIAPSECTSNLARFDGVRYGLRVGDNGENSLEEVMSLTREAGFGAEVKRRIIIGTYALSSGYYDAYYGQAQKVRTLISRDFAAAFERADVLVAPTTPFVAFPFGSRTSDPYQMYLADLYTIPSNLYGGPAISVPCGLSQGLPVGFQIMAPTMADDRMYRVAAALESAVPALTPPEL